MGLGDFVHGVGEAVGNVAKGAAWVARPDHWDDIAEGVGKAGAYVAEHPGQVWDTGFEVGRTMLKDQLKPQNLAITAGLLALTVATGGAAAPALVGEVAEGALVGGEAIGAGAKALSAGASAVKGVEAAGELAKGAETVGTAVKGAEAAGEVVKGAEAASSAVKAGEAASGAAEGLEAAGEATQLSRTGRFAQDVRGSVDAFKEAKGLDKLDKGLNMVSEVKGAARESLGMSRYGMMATKRAAMAEGVAGDLAESGFTATARQMAGRVVAGEGNNAVDQGLYSGLGKWQHRYNQAQNVLDTPQDIKNVGRDVEAAADPVGYAMHHGGDEKVADYVNERAGSGSGYTDIGQTSVGLYGGDEQKAIGSGGQTSGGLVQPNQTSTGMYTQPGRQGAFAEGQQKALGTGQTATGMYAATPPGTPPGGTAYGQAPASNFPQAALPSGQTAGPNATAGQATAGQATAGQATSPYGMQGAGGTAGGPPPTGTVGKQFQPVPNAPGSTGGTPGGQQQQTLKDPGNAPKRKGDWMPQGQHFWEGPRSQWAGGIKANYDWRPVDPLRKIDSGSVQGAAKRAGYQKAKAKWGNDKAAYDEQQRQQGEGNLNEQGAPEAWSPEVPKSGMYAVSAGQQPEGALNPGQPKRPELDSGPVVRMGEARGARHNLTNVSPLRQPIGAIGPGPSNNNSFIDADSSSPDDFKFDNSGQGYMDFANTMGTAAVGPQPNTNPMYSSGSRTSRRAISAA